MENPGKKLLPQEACAHEDRRVAALHHYNILYTGAEADYDDIVALAATLCCAPIAMISLLDRDKQWFKARTGLLLTETARDISFCTHAIRQPDLFVVPDATRDERFARNPMVTDYPKVRFYAGMPLTTVDGIPLGTLCVMDVVPRQLSELQAKGLKVLARQVMRLLELRTTVSCLDQQAASLQRANAELHKSNYELQASEEEIRSNLDQIEKLQSYVALQEQRYKELVENASDLIYELDADGRFTFANSVMESVAGYDRQALIGLAYNELVHPLDRERVHAFYQAQRRNLEETSYLQFRMRSRSGQDTWIGQNVRMFYRANGFVYKVSAISRDITHLKKTELLLKESEKKFRMLSEQAPVGIFQTNSAGLCSYVNKRWSEITGMNGHDALADGWIQGIHPEDRHKIFSEWMDAVTQKKEFMFEFRYINPVTGIRWVNGRAAQVGEPDQPVTYIGTVTDITEVREMHRKLAESEELYSLLTTNTKDLITLLTPEENPVRIFVSPSSREILGYDPPEMIGRSPFELVAEEDRERIKQFTTELLRCGTPYSAEIRVRRKDGTIIWLETKGTPLLDAKGVLRGIQTASRDIGKRKEFEAGLKEAKERAEEATLAKSKFLSMMSHEIRTPMNAIIGLTNILLSNGPKEDQLENLKLLKFSGDNLLTIINDILDFSKIEAGKITLECIDIPLATLVGNTQRMLEPRGREKGIQLLLEYDSRLPHVVQGDSVRLAQVITNLAGNAIKFTEKGSVRISVRYEGSLKGQHRIRFAVHDTGIGIAADKLETIFERFSQADGDTTRKFGGTGLGLSITRSLVELMGGTITVSSTPGVGSVFSFTLSMAEGKHVADLATPVARSGEQLEKFSARILLVEDNAINQVVAASFLRSWGLQVDIANHGREALDRIAGKAYDLVLMDVQMPVMDGFEATQTIRAMDDAYFKHLPIIALTASAMLGMRDKVMEAGMNDFVSKPFAPEELHRKIAFFLAPKKSQAA